MVVALHLSFLVLLACGVAALALVVLPLLLATVLSLLALGCVIRAAVWARNRPADATLIACALAVAIALVVMPFGGAS